jgi:hypothetical protein
VIRRVINEEVIQRIEDFNDPHQEWAPPLLGALRHVLPRARCGPGGGMMSQAFPNNDLSHRRPSSPRV